MERAYSTVTITKALASEGVVEGLASVPSVDRQGDIVESKGVRWRKDASGKPDVPWLMQHRHDEPIGRVEWLQAKPDGLRFRARMPQVDGPPALKERLQTAFAEISSGLVRGISIGFMPLKAEPIETGWRFKEISLFEISSVTIPACEEACVEVVKRYDEAARRGDIIDTPDAAQAKAHERAMKLLDEHLWPVRQRDSKPVIYTQGQHDMITQGFITLMSLCTDIYVDLETTEKRLRSIEQKGLESPLQYRGVWKPGTYAKGSFITHGGSVFHADKDTDLKPGEGGGWTLAVKSGRDGKDSKWAS